MYYSFTDVHMYGSTTNSWEFISNMTIGRHCCFAAVLPYNQLMVVGGITDTDDEVITAKVEFASVREVQSALSQSC